VAGRCADDGEPPHGVRVSGGVHQTDVPTPADAHHVDRAEPEDAPDSLHVLDQLVLRALLDGHPLRAPVASVVPEDQATAENAGQRTERADVPARIGAGPAVEDEAGRSVPHDLGVKSCPVDRELHVS